MELHIRNAGRRFNRDWIFRGLDCSIPTNAHVLITGPNGSGKSTLLQAISGFLSLSEGEIAYTNKNAPVHPEHLWRQVALCTPYLDLFEDLTLHEAVQFQEGFRDFRDGWTTASVIERTGLETHRSKQLKNFSSGMRQRVKLALALLSDASLILLDEPTSNLDRQGVDWYRNLLTEHAENRTIVISSNHNTDEYLRADIAIDITSLK
ncbi:MAG: ATP-binding cassette domain-containing protein [Flavobacteriales bacterium]